MEIRYVILFLLIIIISNSTIGQQNDPAIEKVKSKYSYKSYLYSYSDMSPIFETDPEAVILYYQSRSAKKVADIFGYTSASLLTLGGISLIALREDRGDSPSLGPIYFVLFASMATIPGTIGILYNRKYKAKRSRAIRLFNYNQSEQNIGYIEDPYIIQIGPTSHGYGFSVRF